VRLSLGSSELAEYVRRQLENLFPDAVKLGDLPRFVALALERVEYCFERCGLKGFSDHEGAVFSHRHTDQYAIFLYYLSNSAFLEKFDHPIAERAYALNKALHALDAYYEVSLPKVFGLQHPVGTVLGRANYDDYFFCYQNCTVGANLAGESPTFGRGVVMYGGSRVIGCTSVGDNTFIAAGTIIIDRGAWPSNSILHGAHPNERASPTKRQVIRDIFHQSENGETTIASGVNNSFL
jgi:serine O-acetyltransferase